MTRQNNVAATQTIPPHTFPFMNPHRSCTLPVTTLPVTTLPVATRQPSMLRAPNLPPSIPGVLSGVQRVALQTVCVILAVHIGAPTVATAQTLTINSPTVRFANEIRVPTAQAGRISSLAVRLNQSVRRGDELFRIDDAIIQRDLIAARLRLDSARRDAEDRVALDYAEVTLKEAKEEYESSRLVQQEAHGAISTNTMRRLRLTVERSQLGVAQANLELRRAQSQVLLAEAELERMTAEAADRIIVSPLDGVVTELNFSTGEWVSEGSTVAVVAEISELRIDALVDSNDLNQNECVGLPVTASWNPASHSHALSLKGTVESADLQRFNGSTYRIHAIVQNQRVEQPTTAAGTVSSTLREAWLLKPGTPIKLTIHRDPPPPHVSVRW